MPSSTSKFFPYHVVAIKVCSLSSRRVKLPKSFLAVNLSEAFSFESQERPDDEDSFLEMRHLNYAAASEPEDDELSHLDDIPAGTDSGKAIDKTGPS